MNMSLNILVVIEKNSWVDFHIAESLEQLGHTVHRFYFGEYVSEFYGVSRRSERLKNCMLNWMDGGHPACKYRENTYGKQTRRNADPG